MKLNKNEKSALMSIDMNNCAIPYVLPTGEYTVAIRDYCQGELVNWYIVIPDNYYN